ncbi:MAG: hypothetical protein VB046_06735 [Paludibacter sp.]|nr:hypothetical protein [Paludibacter sp.]
MENAVLKRFRQFIKDKNVSYKMFCEEIEIPEATLKSLFQRNSYPTTEILIKTLNKYPDLSLDWLLMGYKKIQNTHELRENNVNTNNNPSKTNEPGYSQMIEKISELSGKLAMAENKIKELEKELQEKADLVNRSATKETFPEFGK